MLRVARHLLIPLLALCLGGGAVLSLAVGPGRIDAEAQELEQEPEEQSRPAAEYDLGQRTLARCRGVRRLGTVCAGRRPGMRQTLCRTTPTATPSLRVLQVRIQV